MSKLEKTISEYFKTKPSLVFLALFGSYAKKTANNKSDVDIAVFFQKTHLPSPFTLISWREEISALINKDVDLVCLNTASPIIGMQVHKTGKILLLQDEREYAYYQMALFSDYAELKEVRAPMEKDILKRKLYD